MLSKETKVTAASAFRKRSVFNNTIAVQNVYRNSDEFVSISLYQSGHTGQELRNIGKFVKKGDRIGVEGRLNTRRYTNRIIKKVYVTEVVIEEVYFLRRKHETERGRRRVARRSAKFVVE